MNNLYKICPMTEGDLDAIVKIEEECFSVPWKWDDFSRFLSAENALFYTVKCTEDVQCCDENGNFSIVPSGSVAGYIGMYFVLPNVSDDGQTIYEGMGDIVNVAVAKSLRRRGIARDMLNAIINDAKRLFLSTLMLEVRESNVSARSLYRSMGFEEVGVRKNYYSNPRENAILMNLSTDIFKL